MKKAALHVLALQDVEDLRRPLGVGAVVEADGALSWGGSRSSDRVGVRIHVHVLVDDQTAILVIFRCCPASPSQRCAMPLDWGVR